MAAIKEYISQETPNGAVGPSAAQAGQAAGGIYEGLGSGLVKGGEALQRYGEQQESSKFSVDHSAMTAAATNAWEEIKKNGNADDPDVRDKFLAEYDDKVDSLADNITAPSIRAHANAVIAETKAHFSTTTLADMSTAAGAKAIERVTDVKNNGAAAAFQDPTFFDSQGNVTGMYIAASGLPQNEVPKATIAIQKELAKATVDGMLDREDTVNARKDLEGSRFDKVLDGSEKAALLRKVTTVERAQDAAARLQAEQKKQLIKDTSDKTESAYHALFADPGYLTSSHTAEYASDPKLTPEAQERLIKFQDYASDRQKKAGEAQPAEQPGLIAKHMAAINAGTETDDSLLAALKDGDGISVDNYKYLYGRLHTKGPTGPAENRMLSSALDTIRLAVVGPKPAFGAADTMTPAQSNDRTAAEGYLFSKLAGKTGQQLIDALNPDSKDAVLTPAILAQFARHTKKTGGLLGDIKASVGAPAVPAAPKVPLADFLKGP